MKKNKLFLRLVLAGMIFIQGSIVYADISVNGNPGRTLNSRKNPGVQEVQQPAQKKKISGVVKDEAGNELVGVSVLIKGTTTGVVTDASGNFSLEVPVGSTLKVAYMGYVSQEINVSNQTNLSIILKEDIKMLEDVVVLGYGMESRKADLSTAVGIVENVDMLKSRPVSSVADMLQGQIPGVTITKVGGDPEAAIGIAIRGIGSRKSESPLWVVDGVPGAPVNFNDIESIVVLKDAASAAIYGAYSGSSGIILVTTKQAAAGKAQVTFESNFNVSQGVNLPQSLTIEEQREVRRKSLEAEGNQLPLGWDPVKNPYIATTRTDWIDEIFRNSLSQRHSVALNAGNENFGNRISLQYNDDQGILLSSFSKSLTLRVNSYFKINEKIKIREDLYWINSESRGVNTLSGYSGVVLSALMMPRNAEAYYADGTYGGTAPKDPDYITKYGSNFADIHGDVINPIRSLKSENIYNRPTRTTSSTFLDVDDIIPGLKLTSRFTYSLENVFYKRFRVKRPEPGKPDLTNGLNYSSSRYHRWEIENTLNYSGNFGNHNIGAMLSTTSNKQEKRFFNAERQGFINEDEAFQYFGWGDINRTVVGDGMSDMDANLSAVGRVSYSWNDRYFATASFRRDYAGRLPEGKKYGNFPAVTAAWKLSSEPFLPQSKTLNLLKLRASWGRIGNISTVPLIYGDPTYNIESSGDVGGQVGYNTPTIPMMVFNGKSINPFLTWETSEQVDIGADIEMFDRRLSLSLDYFTKKTYDLIKQQDTGWPRYVGPSPMYINQGEVKNRGFEVVAGWTDKIGDVEYFINGNIATLKNWVSDIGPAHPQTGLKPVWTDGESFREMQPYRTREGDPMYSFWVYKTDGLFQTDAEAAAYVNKEGQRIQPNAKAGDLKFVDINGDGVLNEDDREYRGNYMPELTYALTGGLRWKNLSASVMLQGIEGAKVYHGAKYVLLNEAMVNFNRSNKILKAWPVTNDIPRLSSADPNGNFSKMSDFYLEDGSYMRIKNITVSYQFDKLLQSISSNLGNRKSSLILSVSVDNVHTFTKYTGMDPEVGGIGMDGGRYPVPRTYSLGVKVTY